jgi:hypothetical protein
MKRTLFWSVGSFLAAASVAAVVGGAWPRTASGEDAAAAKPAYIGADGCKKCHIKQFKSWQKTPMALAFDHLKAGESADKKTAAKLDPKADYTKDPKCLKCHTSGYGTATGYPAVVEGTAWKPEEEARAKLNAAGTCEVCHGPGSLYSPFKTGDHKAFKKSEVIALGMVLPVTAETCAPCHKAGGCPTMPADYKLDFDAVIKKPELTHEKVPLKEQHD